MSDKAGSTGAQDHSLWHLVYASAATEGFQLTDLEEILRVARTNNARDDITGMLLFEGKSFLQVLEGERWKIDVLLEKIRDDRRHARTVLLLREPIEQRSFADWTMGYTRVALGELQDATGVNDFFADQSSFADMDSAKVKRLLELFRSGFLSSKTDVGAAHLAHPPPRATRLPSAPEPATLDAARAGRQLSVRAEAPTRTRLLVAGLAGWTRIRRM